MGSFFSSVLAFVQAKGFGILIIAAILSFTKAVLKVVGILKFGEGKSKKCIFFLIFLEIPILFVSFVIAVMVGYFSQEYLIEHGKPLFWAYGFAGLASIIGSNVLMGLVHLNFGNVMQKKVDKMGE